MHEGIREHALISADAFKHRMTLGVPDLGLEMLWLLSFGAVSPSREPGFMGLPAAKIRSIVLHRQSDCSDFDCSSRDGSSIVGMASCNHCGGREKGLVTQQQTSAKYDRGGWMNQFQR